MPAVFTRSFICFGLCWSLLFAAAAQAPTWTWAQQVGGSARDLGIVTASDRTGNVYETGSFNGSLQLGTATLVSTPRDLYVVKYNRQGAVQWARQGNVQAVMGGAAGAEGHSAVTDAAGNLYVSGSFTGTLTVGAVSLTAPYGPTNAFILKFDAAGTALWGLANSSSSNHSTATGLAVSAAGDVYMSGAFSTSTTFGGLSVVSQGDTDVFLAKLNAAGVPQWVQAVGGSDRDYAAALAPGPNNGVYLSGGCSATAFFGPFSVVSRGGTDAFLALYDAQGAAQWVQSYGGGSDDGAGPMAVTPTGELCTTGFFQNTATFGARTLTSQGGYDGFVLKCTAQGLPVWASSMGGSGTDTAFGLVLGASGDVYVSGTFAATATFGNQARTSAGGADIYVARYSAAGGLTWVTQCGGTGDDFDAGLAAGGNGALYVGGQFTGSAQFGPLALTSRGGVDSFVAQVQDNTPTATPTRASTAQYSLYPNPVGGGSVVTLALPANVQEIQAIDLLDAVGKPVHNAPFQAETRLGRAIQLNLHGVAPGKYLVRVSTSSTTVIKPLIVY